MVNGYNYIGLALTDGLNDTLGEFVSPVIKSFTLNNWKHNLHVKKTNKQKLQYKQNCIIECCQHLGK